MRRGFFVACAAIVAGVGPASAQLISDSDVAHFAGCYVVEAGAWDLYPFEIATEDLPMLPTRLELSLQLLFRPQTGPITVERQAKAYGSDGRRLPPLERWRAPNPRRFSVGGVDPDVRIVIDARLTESGELEAWATYMPPDVDLRRSVPASMPTSLLELVSVDC